ncbi:GNAT family N-acetyltransferase [Roseateles sp. BYS180W]|uniref:GNAT family N-acetyltransferase n=1 Tax=Roseateles rivi TaxID=3299028 RepID=A0ABW7FT60_9BURK
MNSTELTLRLEPSPLAVVQLHALLEEHLADMRRTSPPDSVYALPLQRLSQPDVRLWTAWQGTQLLGCGALKHLQERHGELKSMRTATAWRGHGVGRALLRQLMADARAQGLSRLSLETGTAPFFAPAHALYLAHGFEDCGPFADYAPDPHSRFMTRLL